MLVVPEAAPTEQLLENQTIEKSQSFHLREVPNLGKRFLGRSALILSLAMGAGTALGIGESAVTPRHAEAATAFTNDYPDLTMPCEHAPYNTTGACANYDWGPKHTSAYNDPSEISSRGYAYRNCTDGVAYWVNEYDGVNIAGWGDAKNWSTAAPSNEVHTGNTNSIEPGDIAQDDAGTYGHVGFVTDVSTNTNGSIASITVAEMNKDAQGDFSHDTYASRSSSGNFIRNTSGATWGHFIDVNGPGKGLNNEILGGSGNSGLKESSAIVDRVTGRNIFYVGADNNIWQWSVIGGHWSNVKLQDGSSGEPVAPGTSPSAVEDLDTGRNVFYIGVDNAIWQWSVQNNAWHNNRLGGNVRPGTSPSAVTESSSGRNIFYVDANGTIEQLSVQHNQWLIVPLGGIALTGTSPTAVVDVATGRNVFYVGLDSRISQLSVMNNQWVNVELNDPASNQTVATGSSPNAVEDPSTGRNIFYAGVDNRVWQYSEQNGAWHNNKLTDGVGNQTVLPGTSPNAITDSETGRNIFYTGPDNQIWQYCVQNNAWHNFKLTGAGGNPAVDVGTSPGAVVDPTTGRNVFYFNNGSIWQWSVQNNTWTNFPLQY